MPMTNRGLHPDYSEDGERLPDADLPPAERDHLRRMQDPGERASYMQRVESWQRTLPYPVQQAVSGQSFRDVAHYRSEVARLMDTWGSSRGTPWLVTDHDISDMSLQEYDSLFDERGVPRDRRIGVHFQRAIKLDDSHPR